MKTLCMSIKLNEAEMIIDFNRHFENIQNQFFTFPLCIVIIYIG
jgi:hypothetical protein